MPFACSSTHKFQARSASPGARLGSAKQTISFLNLCDLCFTMHFHFLLFYQFCRMNAISKFILFIYSCQNHISFSIFSQPQINHFLFYCFESLLKILNNIINILCSDGQTDRIRFNSLVKQFFFCALAVCRSSRMDHKRFYICYVCQQRE